jgi:glycosyltransferase involved in cell wall biosynthesis
MAALVSILIPAYNAEEFVADAIRSAMAQTWRQKEIIVVDDGSTDRTAEVARKFASKDVAIVSKQNEGAAATRNHAFELSRGDYIQWLDADDLLAPDKIERQLAALREDDTKWTLLSSSWGHFRYRTEGTRFVPTPLWQDLTPVEWILRKMGRHLSMQTATWLTSRELTEAAGPWDTRLHVDDDGEYFCRALLSSRGTRFVPEAKVYYRDTPSSRVSHLGISNKKKDALLLSMKLHIQYLRSLEESSRVQEACLNYLQTFYVDFYPERPDLMAELQALATELGGRLEEPKLRWKFAWMKPIVGFKAAKRAQVTLPDLKGSLLRKWDKAVHVATGGRRSSTQAGGMTTSWEPGSD